MKRSTSKLLKRPLEVKKAKIEKSETDFNPQNPNSSYFRVMFNDRFQTKMHITFDHGILFSYN